MKKEILVVLGSPNSSSGVLSNMSKSRLDYCKSIFIESNLIICTGGWGKQFNVSTRSHGFYAKEYLIEKGLTEKNFLEIALSSNTVDDAVKIKSILSNLENFNLTIITSDYHLNRVKLIFKEILEDYNMSFIGVDGDFNEEKYELLLKHENAAIRKILKNGLYY